jgi:hypothetical protein
LERSIREGSAGHGVRTTAAGARFASRTASIVSRVWLIVPSPGRGDHDRHGEINGEIPHQVVVPERHQEATDSFADEQIHVLGGLERGATETIGIDLLPGELGGEVRRDGGPVSVRDDLVVALPRPRREAKQRVIGKPRGAFPDLWPER